MKKAFTLLELLVVIGIISILVAMGAVSYSSAQKKARDSKRSSDLKAIQSALEQYNSVCQDSPSTYNFSGDGNLSGSLTCTSPATTFITYPTDPLGGSYQCVTDASTGNACSSTNYMICPPDLGSTKYLESGTCTSVNQNCCVTNQQ